jgi:hypothetical protein
LRFPRSFDPSSNLSPPHTALAEQALAKVRAAVDALADDAWMYDAPQHSNTE